MFEAQKLFSRREGGQKYSGFNNMYLHDIYVADGGGSTLYFCVCI